MKATQQRATEEAVGGGGGEATGAPPLPSTLSPPEAHSSPPVVSGPALIGQLAHLPPASVDKWR